MTQEVRQYRKPENDRLKCNLDVSVLHNVDKTSYGAVDRILKRRLWQV